LVGGKGELPNAGVGRMGTGDNGGAIVDDGDGMGVNTRCDANNHKAGPPR
jgi:hypothetical protein